MSYQALAAFKKSSDRERIEPLNGCAGHYAIFSIDNSPYNIYQA